ncbi:cytochrome P450 89A2-like [Lycium barbarum]|uniref:cytochrome P450 89A2-like n=1 Tax=Lycium barbarum TaxID=112863 RepID=UPI00293EFBC9|nr:cytochrome P450 89A2-like [Lycium barbarum]
MESWLLLLLIIILTLFLSFLFKSNNQKKVPPGPSAFSVISSFLRANADIELILRDLKTKYGPVFNFRIGLGFRRPSIYVASHSLAYQALVKQGAIYSDRPKASLTLPSSRINMASSPYGPTWRLLRRNLVSEMLHPSRTKSYSKVLSRVLSILIQQLRADSAATEVITLIDQFRYAMFYLLVLMCFGDKIDEPQVKQIQDVQRRWILTLGRFINLSFFPTSLQKIIFRNQWKELIQMIQEQERVFIPLIEARMKAKTEEGMVAYKDTLLNLEFPEEKRKFNHGEIVSLCSEFLTGGTDTTSTSLQWIMANLVKYPSIQEKLYQEISDVVNKGNSKPKEVKEEDLQKMPYLKAVILEGLRRHPPGHFLQPHAVTEEVELNGYVIPKDATITFMVADMNLDPNVWENPLDFKPDRFLSVDGDTEAFDITGNREIKMMPFGAGRRMCPGYGLAMFHMEYFVANLIWHFEWKAVDGDDIDLSEKLEFAVTMKNPLRARIRPRQAQIGKFMLQPVQFHLSNQYAARFHCYLEMQQAKRGSELRSGHDETRNIRIHKEVI